MYGFYLTAGFFLNGGILAALELWFLSRFVGCQAGKRDYILYIGIIYLLNLLGLRSPSLFLAVSLLLLFLTGIQLGGRRSAVFLASVLTLAVVMLAAGLMNTVSYALLPKLLQLGKNFSFFFGLASCLSALAVCWGFFRLILKHFLLSETMPKQYMAVFFFPVLLILLMQQYISAQVYGNVIRVEGAQIIEPQVDNLEMLCIQALGCISLFSILTACKKISESLENQSRMALLQQEVRAQEKYLQEARRRYEQTRAFRHDLRNHLLALTGLIHQGKTEQAESYLSGLSQIAESLSFPCNTGSAAVDILLGSKLALAKSRGIEAECTVRLPERGAPEELDLCVVLSNAMDNALKACAAIKQEAGAPYIRITGKTQGNFFLLEIENSCAEDGSYEKGGGFGLTNIRSTAEKYQGAVTAQQQGNRFLLHVLFVLSRPFDDI